MQHTRILNITILLFIISGNFLYLAAQSFTSYFTGNRTDLVAESTGGVCLMGGSTENDEAMKWFLSRAGGGDILVLRASGSDGYNDYFFEELGVDLNSVETIVFNNSEASNESYIHERIRSAEGIWFAGGDQWNYVSYWRGTQIETLINEAVVDRNIVIGGTSAGMAILGDHYFSARNGTISSSEALTNPYHSAMSVDSTSFLEVSYMEDVITDTHFAERDREGRLVSFMARAFTDYASEIRGIAADESIAVCIDPEGKAFVFGTPEDGYAYFVQTNCVFEDRGPEVCQPSEKLVWDKTKNALKVYKVKGTNGGRNYLDLNEWKDGIGGEWRHWYVQDGEFFDKQGSENNCILVSTGSNETPATISITPNPVNDQLRISNTINLTSIKIFDAAGKQVLEHNPIQSNSIIISTESLVPGKLYLVDVETAGKERFTRRIITR